MARKTALDIALEGFDRRSQVTSAPRGRSKELSRALTRGDSFDRTLKANKAKKSKAIEGELGRGGKRAENLLKRIMASDASESEKLHWQRVYEKGGESKKNPSVFDRVKHIAFQPIEKGLMVMEKPFRAVEATLEEGGEAGLLPFGAKLNEDDASWMDRVFRDKWGTNGYGHFVERQHQAAKEGKSFGLLGKSGSRVAKSILDNTAAKLGVSFAGEMAFDPTNYFTGGARGVVGGVLKGAAEDAAKEGVEQVAKGAARKTAAAAAEKAASAAIAREAGLQSKKAVRLSDHQVAQRFARAGMDAEALAVKKGGRYAVTAEDLAKIGVDSHMRWAGVDLAGHDVIRNLPGVQKAYQAKSAVGRGITGRAAKLGAEELRPFRKVIRELGDGPLVDDAETAAQRLGDAMRSMDARAVSKGAEQRFSAEVTSALAPVAREAKRMRLSGEDLRALYTDTAKFIADKGVTDPEKVQALHKLGDDLEAGFEAARVAANSKLGYEWLPKGVRAEGQRWMPGVLTQDALDTIGATGKGKAGKGSLGIGQARSFEKRSLKAGDTLPFRDGTIELGSDEADAMFGPLIENQIEGVFKANYGGAIPEDFYVKNMYDVMDQYASNLTRRVGEKTWQQELTDRGVIREATVHALGELADDVDGQPLSIGDVQRLVADPEGTVAQARARAERLAARGDDAASHADQAARFAEAIGTVDDPDLRHSLALGVQAEDLASRMSEKGLKGMPMDRAATMLADAPGAKRFKAGLSDGFKMFGSTRWEEAPDFVVEAVGKMFETAVDPVPFSRFIDAVNRVFKTYAIMSPGFLVRNSYGAYFNNFVNGVDLSSYKLYTRLNKAWKEADGVLADMAVTDGEKAVWSTVLEHGLVDESTRAVSEVMPHLKGDLSDFKVESKGLHRVKEGAQVAVRRRVEAVEKANSGLEGLNAAWGGLLTDNPASRGMSRLNERVEHYHRGAMFLDTLRKGGSADEALGRVATFHFDYTDLSNAEKFIGRRFIPFWTWTSRNLPLQLEMAWSSPKMYQRWVGVKRTIEEHSQEDPTAPDYLRNSLGSIRLPGNALGQALSKVPIIGSPAQEGTEYVSADLPFVGVDEQMGRFTSNPMASVMQDASPLFKTPIELKTGKQFFADIPIDPTGKPVALPRSLFWLEPALRGLGWTKGRDGDGNQMVDAETLYTLEQFMPLIGRLRRQLPSEDRYQQRKVTSWLSFLGFGTRTNTPSMRESEMYRRGDAMDEFLKVLEARGKPAPKLKDLNKETARRRRVNAMFGGG